MVLTSIGWHVAEVDVGGVGCASGAVEGDGDGGCGAGGDFCCGGGGDEGESRAEGEEG